MVCCSTSARIASRRSLGARECGAQCAYYYSPVVIALPEEQCGFVAAARLHFKTGYIRRANPSARPLYDARSAHVQYCVANLNGTIQPERICERIKRTGEARSRPRAKRTRVDWPQSAMSTRHGMQSASCRLRRKVALGVTRAGVTRAGLARAALPRLGLVRANLAGLGIALRARPNSSTAEISRR